MSLECPYQIEYTWRQIKGWLSFSSHYIHSIRSPCWVELSVPFQLDSDICQWTVGLAETASRGSEL